MSKWGALAGLSIAGALAAPTARPAPAAPATARAPVGALALTLRSRHGEAARGEVVEQKVRWPGDQTAVIVVDMWDHHFCPSAERGGAQMVPRMNRVLQAVRDRGGLVVDAPSGTVALDAQAPQRTRARSAPAAEPAPVGGDRWIPLDPKAEGPLPIDDSDGGCPCEPTCVPAPKKGPQTRQNADLVIAPADAISDDGREIY